jgi:hypothetical protein
VITQAGGATRRVRLQAGSSKRVSSTNLEWARLEGALASLLVDVATDIRGAHEQFVEWCNEYIYEIRAVAVHGVKPLTDSTLDRFLGRRA